MRQALRLWLTRGRCQQCGRQFQVTFQVETDPADLRSPCCNAPVTVGMQSVVPPR